MANKQLQLMCGLNPWPEIWHNFKKVPNPNINILLYKFYYPWKQIHSFFHGFTNNIILSRARMQFVIKQLQRERNNLLWFFSCVCLIQMHFVLTFVQLSNSLCCDLNHEIICCKAYCSQLDHQENIKTQEKHRDIVKKQMLRDAQTISNKQWYQ